MKDIAAEIQQAVVKAELANARRGSGSRAASNHASQLGSECLRQLYYHRTSAHLRPAPSERTAFVWKVGRMVEREARRDLEAAGYEVTLAQGSFRWDAYNIVGSVDGFVSIDGESLPIEIKSCSDHYWDELTSIEAMKTSRHAWVRNYPAQLCLYLVMSNHPRGLFYLVNKATGQPRVLLMEIDWELAERCVQAAQSVNECVEMEEPPERPPFDAARCRYCDYRDTICSPPQPPRPRIDDAEMLAFLKDHEALKEASRGYKKSQDRLKELFPEEAVVMCGPWEITVTKTKRGLSHKVRNIMEEED